MIAKRPLSGTTLSYSAKVSGKMIRLRLQVTPETGEINHSVTGMDEFSATR